MISLARIPLLVLLAVSCSTQRSVKASEIHECIIVDDAEIVASPPSGLNELESNLWAANSGHQLRSGSSSVLSLRIFSEKDGVADSQYFTKITGFLNDGGTLGAKKLEHGYFSSGWSGFAYKADFWASDEISVDINPLPGREGLVEVVGLISAENAYRREKKEFELHFTCKLSRRALTELSPWQGGAGDIWSSFYP
ncbi:hypothetical protein [Xanthomonas sp. 1678]|uniref:hypothetical protein n=1 Tax=Xanthomonas sp. 1678 TaxID=3158788 RepID=UPI00285F5FB8|nr:hypothetical protein [Xanthomonas translucens]